jgi:hypothetical protein
MKILRIVLLAAGLVCLSGLIGIFVPIEAVGSLVASYGINEGLSGPMFEYVFRLSAAVVASCGFFYLFLAYNPRRHGALVPVSGAAIIFVGLVLLLTGFSTDMAAPFFVADFLSCVFLGSAILVTWMLWGRGGMPE